MVNKPPAKANLAVLIAPTMMPTTVPTVTFNNTLMPTKIPTVTTKPLPTKVVAVPIEQKPMPTAIPTFSSLTEAVNNFRQNQGKVSLKTNTELCLAARSRAEKVGSNLTHDGYQEALKTIPHSGSGENLWWGTKVSITAIIEAWNGSEGHRQNMLGDWSAGCGEVVGNTAVFLFIK